jgi:hypothetical protein
VVEALNQGEIGGPTLTVSQDKHRVSFVNVPSNIS